MLRSLSRLLMLVLLCSSAAAQTKHRIYAHLMDPREHPDDSRRAVRPPDWNTFGGRTHFTTLRGFEVRDGRLVGFREELDRYTRKADLGDVIWPSYPVLFAANLGELADEIAQRKLFLFDIWGYVPGSGPGGYWQQFKPPAAALEMLESKLGERWLGMDNGEQDGRYLGRFAAEMHPRDAGRFEQYLNFMRHFEGLTTELGGRMSTLVSLNFGHYFLKEGIYTLAGAETAQALPNAQVYYAFLRGAGKQYGVPWFGNASVWNRWGFKSYDPPGSSDGAAHSPRKGTSVSLLKRLMYSHILYNSMLAGFESGWLRGEELTPVGKVQQAAKRWTERNGPPGVMVTPIALLLDFYSGWTFPRHLYTKDVYRVWGNLPYGPGDYFTDGVLDMLYPGYRDASYFHDESGFLTPTPYGDGADVLLSDAPQWVLARYPLIVVAGELAGGAEVRDKLQRYIDGGGRLVITAGTLAKLPGGLLGATVIQAPFGISGTPQGPMPASEIDRPFGTPYPLGRETREMLDRVFREELLFEAGEGLSVIVCRRREGEYTLGILNNFLAEKPFRIQSHIGAIEAIRELPLDQSEKQAEGYLPEGYEGAKVGTGGDGRVAGGDVRIFAVRVREKDVEEIPHVPPPPRPQDRWLALGTPASIQREVLRRPTFFQHFDGATVDWRYLRSRTLEAIRAESAWIRQQKLRVAVDLTSGINLYPDLRLVNNDPAEYARSIATIEDVLAKMPAIGARDLIVSLHVFPENNMTRERAWEEFAATLRRVSTAAQASGIVVHLRLGGGRPPQDTAEAARFVRTVGARNLKLAAEVNNGVLRLDSGAGARVFEGPYHDLDDEYRAVLAAR